MKALIVAAALLVAATGCADSANDSQTAGTDGATTAGGTTVAAGAPGGTVVPSAAPRLPDDFQWTGRYIVPNLGVEVPFTWNGSDGNLQMTAGGDDDPIHFTNLIYDGELYTLTYEWPDVPRMPCSNLGPFTLDELNAGFAAAPFVGAETLDDAEPREVNHFRAGLVWSPPTDVIPAIPGVPQIRIPIMSGDIYVDRDDPTVFWKLLHFGLQNLYDEELDEWIVIDSVNDGPGAVTLPEECVPAAGGGS